jgi:proline racemase
LCDVGERIRLAAKEQLDERISIVQIAEPWQGIDRVTKNAVVIAPGRLDRSATGTGLSARMAVLHRRGLMKVGDAMTHASAIGSAFDGRIVAETDDGIVPAIRGSAFITGVTELYVDPRDPFPEGYLLSDTWPGDDVQ